MVEPTYKNYVQNSSVHLNWILTEDKLREKLDAKAARYTKYVERIHKNHAKLNQEIKPPIPDLDKLVSTPILQNIQNFDCIDEFNILNFYMTKMIEEIEKIFVTRKFEIYVKFLFLWFKFSKFRLAHPKNRKINIILALCIDFNPTILPTEYSFRHACARNDVHLYHSSRETIRE